jgi:hypothetical protein
MLIVDDEWDGHAFIPINCHQVLKSCIGYLAHPFEKVAPWAFIARLFLVVK